MARSSHVTLTATGFVYQGTDYPYDQVTSLYFYYQVTDVRTLGMHSGNRHDASLDILLQGCPQPIKVRTGFSLTLFADEYKLSEAKAKAVINLHQCLASATFSFRLQRYTEMLQKHGYFFYDNKKIFANGHATDGKREVSLKSDGPWLRKAFMVYCEREKSSMEKILNAFILQDFTFHTLYDADVFFAILDRFFGIRLSGLHG